MYSSLSSLLSRSLIDRGGGYRREVLRRFHELQQFDSIARNDIDAHVSRQLASILNHARSNSPFYRDRIPDTITPDNAAEILRSIPILTKKDIQNKLQKIVVDDIPSFQDATGGSSGEPTVFFTDIERRQAGEASGWCSSRTADAALPPDPAPHRRRPGSHCPARPGQALRFPV